MRLITVSYSFPKEVDNEIHLKGNRVWYKYKSCLLSEEKYLEEDNSYKQDASTQQYSLCEQSNQTCIGSLLKPHKNWVGVTTSGASRNKMGLHRLMCSAMLIE